ncbi:NAD-dependent DNA ligase, putative [Babesia ovis]|uniref:NAD-dependent DNA ligase, putative n=1 Tax=Babesia ovis TaxID=5869 RepID=A0A9W5TBB4_BABOV|nr:NAD-dependent DNA ligase, putative [Babesia ovis]
MRSVVIKSSALLVLLSAAGVNLVIAAKTHHDESGDDNHPDAHDDSSTDELTYPYFNVHYHFNKHDWNKVLEDQNRLIALRRRVAQLRHQINSDARRTNDFLHKQDGMLTDARASLFQRALYNATQPSYARGYKKPPPGIHDRIHYMHDDFYEPIPAADFIDVNEPYYFQMLANQMM